MQIKHIQINGFGSLKDVNFVLKKGLNLVIGENESGKSTLAEFMKAIFYGVDSHKNGKEYSDMEKLKPWGNETFSGKLEYEFQEKQYTIYRDFHKNNAKVFDQTGQEITALFHKDKSRGAQVGPEHLQMDESTFSSSVWIKQKGIKVEDASQSVMLQRLTNMVQSGEEDVSYETTKKKLEKILLEEIGTDRTQNRPKNNLRKEITNLQFRKENLLGNREKELEIEEKLKTVFAHKEQVERNLEEATSVFQIKNKYEQVIQEQKIKLEAEKKAKAMQREALQAQNQRKKWQDTAMIAIAIIILSICLFWVKQYVFIPFAILVGAIAIVCNYRFFYQIEPVIENSNLDTVMGEARKKQGKEIAALEAKGVRKLVTEKKLSELKDWMKQCEKEQQEVDLEEHKLKIEQEALSDSLETLAEVEEELAFKQEKMQVLLQKEAALQLRIS